MGVPDKTEELENRLEAGKALETLRLEPIDLKPGPSN